MNDPLEFMDISLEKQVIIRKAIESLCIYEEGEMNGKEMADILFAQFIETKIKLQTPNISELELPI